jgi:hypothetical protein
MLKWTISGLLIAVLAFAAACGDDDDDDDNGNGNGATATQGGQEAVCDAGQDVQDAATTLTDLDVVSEGTDTLKAATTDLKTEIQSFKSVAGTTVQDEAQALEDSVDEAEQTFDDIDSDETLNEKIDDVQAALTAVVTDAAAFADALSVECD